MSGGSSRSENQTQQTTQNSNVTDNEQAIVAGGDLTMLDGGAIKSAFEYASETQTNFGENFASVLGLVEKSVGAQEKLVGAFAESERVESEAESETMFKGLRSIAVPLAIIGGGVYVVAKVMK